MQQLQLPDIEKTDSKEKTSCLNWTIDNGRIKVCVNFQTDTDKLNFVLYRYRNSLYLKDYEVDLKLTENESHLAKRVYLLSYIDKFYKRCIEHSPSRMDVFFLLSTFRLYPGLQFPFQHNIVRKNLFLGACLFVLGFWTFIT